MPYVGKTDFASPLQILEETPHDEPDSVLALHGKVFAQLVGIEEPTVGNLTRWIEQINLNRGNLASVAPELREP
jgi:hypothetical protein